MRVILSHPEVFQQDIEFSIDKQVLVFPVIHV